MTSTYHDIDMPADFGKRIHQALRAWHTRHTHNVLTDLLLAYQIKEKQAIATPRLISNQILMDGLDSLKQIDEEAAELLQRRFPNQETALAVAHRRNLSENIIFQRQRGAIALLAQVIWEQEMELRQRQIRRIEMRLEPPTYSQLFGVAEKMAQIRARLDIPSEPWIVALEGLGGIGKTSLADKLARDLASGVRFTEIGWTSARKRLFRLSGDVETLPSQPDLTLAELLDRLIEQFELLALRRQPDDAKLAGVRSFLRSQPCLVVIDNLETVADYGTLVSQLRGLVNPSKFLITTRYSLHAESGVYIMPLNALSRDDTLALIRHEAETRGLHELASAAETELEQIYTITGGNPLATKLIIGQIHTLSLPMALARLGATKGKPVQELLNYVYTHTWQTLDPDCRRVLQAMSLVIQEGGRFEQIAAAAELDPEIAIACLQRLAALSLVNVSGSLKERRYSLHQLTRTFLAGQSLDE